MNFLEFEGMTGTLNKNHENGFRPLPFHHDPQTGAWIICCEPSDEEIEWLLKNRKFWFQILSGKHFYPILPIFSDVRFYTVFDGCIVPYERADEKEVLWPYVQGNISQLPPQLMVEGHLYHRTAKWEPQNVGKDKALDVGAIYLRFPTPEEADKRYEALATQAVKLSSIPENKMNDILEELRKNSLVIPVLVKKEQAGRETIIC